AEAGDSDLQALLPESPRRAYDVHPIVSNLLDTQLAADGRTEISSFEELQAKWAPNIVVGFGRLSGRSVGVVANNPLRMGGCLN
ncbi:carboxyl transferase domain-containing protein, partial [Mycobacterium tuberculosis]|uniref:carboxyl transferase domain-containing protein n=1 Tax=Mycobacterium tuberculosis TaxID=1773 RepID=UPI001B2B203B|nr:acyl-CoA carboxylase subunit beta [Mycobacterium tuberculosis]